MSVKVVSPTESGQPQLPMPLRPPVTPPAAGTHHGRPRRTRPRAEGKGRLHPTAAVDPGQPELPMSLRPLVADAGQSELSASPRPAAAAADAGWPEVPTSLRPSAAHADSGQSQPPTSLRPPIAGAELEQVELPISHSPVPVADPGQPELPISLRPPVADAGQSELPASLRPPTADVESGSPDAGRSLSELPASLRPPTADSPQFPDSLRPPAVEGESAAHAERNQPELPMSLRPPAPPVAAGLLAQARRGLAEADRETAPAERFIGAYLAALRGAAAVLAARGRPHRGRARPASTWVLLDSVAPELREWSAFFAGNSAARAAAQAGITGKVTAESAVELVRAATSFLELVRRLVHGLPITGEAHVA
ncbi:hypothetical protein Amsp01_085640 [Amycolatopsis sp. NBRC 101858]|uniref:SAV_6107 family HEPN domain-containing protein n=1 Tax=Amycolatopsis sp. NBRC 101858 TaxID=3032200 RepID=UPI0024A230EA|nr:SAV_6107 family HEPN domain-containing protein [Amycolatopsis sp. NBRC 101858]GLY42541.1 hypothetical protein Amsp01_085640 [Amycolatopsis sp. NBRC 101858]